MCSRRENAAVVLPEHVSLRTERDPSVLVACELSNLSHEHVFLLGHGERSKCAHSVRMQQCCRMKMSVCARSEIQVCSQSANATVLSHENVCLRTERDPSVLAA